MFFPYNIFWLIPPIKIEKTIINIAFGINGKYTLKELSASKLMNLNLINPIIKIKNKFQKTKFPVLDLIKVRNFFIRASFVKKVFKS